MSTKPQRVHLSTNPTDTAVLISANKTLPPVGAVITRGNAAALIDSHYARHDRLQSLTRADTRLLIPLAVVALAASVYLYLNGVPGIWGLPLVAFGGFFALTRLPKPLPLELDQQVAAVTDQDDVLTTCPVPIALKLTEAQHSALRVADDYDVVGEVLNAIIESHYTQLEATESRRRFLLETEQARRRELAKQIMNDHAAGGSRHAEKTGS